MFFTGLKAFYSPYMPPSLILLFVTLITLCIIALSIMVRMATRLSLSQVLHISED